MIVIKDLSGKRFELHKSFCADRNFKATRQEIARVARNLRSRDLNDLKFNITRRRNNPELTDDAFIYAHWILGGTIELGCHKFGTKESAEIILWALN